MACLNTSFLIDVLDGAERARETMERLDDRGERHAVTPISAAELWIGAERAGSRERRRTKRLLESLLWLDVDRRSARRAGTLQAELLDSGVPLGFNDCMIAAAAIEHGHELVTGDEDFEQVPGLQVVRY